ncbi:MAG TPA: hypothetical protein DEF51_33850 [Myxococcales bacterium]|nr:hypothetical protein [Myxococcales bacterium]
MTQSRRRGIQQRMTSTELAPKVELTDAEAWEAFRSLPLDGADLYTSLREHLSTSGFFVHDGDTLEVGAGDGFLWDGDGVALIHRALARGRLVLTDSDPGCVRTCRDRIRRDHPAVVAEEADAARLAYPSASFARVLAIHVLHWCDSTESIRSAVAQLARVMRPDARALVVTVDATVHMAEIYALMQDAKARLEARGVRLDAEIPERPPRIGRFCTDNAASYLHASFGDVRAITMEYAHRVVGVHPHLPIAGEDLVVRYVESAPFLRAAEVDRAALEAFLGEIRNAVAASIRVSGAFRVSRCDVLYECRSPRLPSPDAVPQTR